MSCLYRHWFVYDRFPGSSAPVCQRCGAPNPHYKPELDIAEEPSVRDITNKRLAARYAVLHS